jgi:alanyl-tRNA synthetase
MYEVKSMQTQAIYYEDGYRSRFTATVLSCEVREKNYAVTLDATAFYPEGGGQAGDTGTLGNVRVLDTQEEGESVVHFCDGPLNVGEQVEGVIDFDRRFDLMQQHTGEHMLSGLIHRRYGYHNKGYHVGGDFVTVDFDGVIPQEDLPSLEAELNAGIWRNVPVKCWVPSPEELPNVFYRTKRALPWPVRIVEVPGFDSCACCGIHVASTGAVGVIKILSIMGFRGGSRLEMVSGKRAFDHLRRAYEQNRQVSQAFSAKIMETGEAARKMNEALNAEKFRVTGLQWQLFDHVAASYRGKGNALHFAEGLAPADIRELADRIAKTCGGIAAVFCGNGESYQLCMVCHGGDVKELGAAMNRALRGRGGGKPGFFQGSVSANRQEIEGFFRGCGWEIL